MRFVLAVFCAVLASTFLEMALTGSAAEKNGCGMGLMAVLLAACAYDLWKRAMAE